MGVPKAFRLSPDQIKPLAVGFGACFATDKITVDGERVGWMYREPPAFDVDSGWRFFSGTESDEYVDDHANTSIYDVNSIANNDPDIIPLLDAPTGAAFARDPLTGRLTEADPPEGEP
jgi:hypothetical protein